MKTGTPSRTAEYMALFRALESARPEGKRLFEDRTAASFLRPSLRAVALAARFGPARSLIFTLIDRRWPGPRLSGVVRTRVIDGSRRAASDAAESRPSRSEAREITRRLSSLAKTVTKD